MLISENAGYLSAGHKPHACGSERFYQPGERPYFNAQMCECADVRMKKIWRMMVICCFRVKQKWAYFASGRFFRCRFAPVLMVV